MRDSIRNGLVRHSWLSAFGSVVLLACIAPATAKQIRLGIPDPPVTNLSPPRVDLITGTIASRLEQARALAANENWEDAVDIFQQLIAENSDRVVALDDGRYIGLRTYCHMQLAILPAEALASYRRRVDPLAERWYRKGIANREEALLRQIVEQFYCSTWGDNALMALGEMALERADNASARRWWLQLSPALRDPTGLPIWIALRDIDLDTHWNEIEQRWTLGRQLPQWLAYPDTEFKLADIEARLVLASIRAGQRNRAALELDVLRRRHPETVGRLGGQDVPYATTLERLLLSAGENDTQSPESDWLTFAGSPSRSPHAPPLASTLVPIWQVTVPIAVPALARSTRTSVLPGLLFEGLFDEQPRPEVAASPSLNCFPAVVDGNILFADALGIHAVALDTGEPTISVNGHLYRLETNDASRVETRVPATYAHGVPRYTLTIFNNVVYSRVGPAATTLANAPNNNSGSRILGLDLSRDGLLTFRARPSNVNWTFDGVPICDGRRLFVAMRSSEVTPQAHVACFDAATGVHLWQTPIGSADTLAPANSDEITHNLLTLVGDRIYFNTNLGLVAAIDVADGAICWLHRYERSLEKVTNPPQFGRDPSPCLYHDGVVIIAPMDSSAILALDADTGRRIWRTDSLLDAQHLLGIVGENLIAGGQRLAAVDVRSGVTKYVWPDSVHAGVRGMGRGVIAGEEVFWPTRTEIYVVHALTGQRTRAPISLSQLGEHGANLVVATGHLVVATHDVISVFGPQPSAP